MNNLPIKTKRLRLRRFEEGDLDAFIAYRSDPRVGLYQGWLPPSRDEAREFLTEAQHGALEQPGRWFQIAIARRESNALVGDIGICLIGRNEAEIGFSLAAAAQGCGYGSEAIAALAHVLFGSYGLQALRAITDTRNERSIALLRRLGFGLKRTSGEIFRGQWCEQHHFVLAVRQSGNSGD